MPSSSSPAVAVDEVVSRALVLGLAVLGALDLDVEHVELAVGGRDLPRGVDQDRGVVRLAAVGGVLGNAAGAEMDAEILRPASGGA